MYCFEALLQVVDMEIKNQKDIENMLQNIKHNIKKLD